jgi:hypothetical protein
MVENKYITAIKPVNITTRTQYSSKKTGLAIKLFFFHHKFNLVRVSVIASSGFNPLRSQLRGIESWSSLPSSEPTNDWLAIKLI